MRVGITIDIEFESTAKPQMMSGWHVLSRRLEKDVKALPYVKNVRVDHLVRIPDDQMGP